MMQNIYLTYKFLICLALSEKIIFSNRINYYIGFFSTIDIIKYIFYLFDKDIYPLKSKEFLEYIKLNKKKWTNFKKKKIVSNNKEAILIESFISHPSYILRNAVIAKYLQLFDGSQCIGLLRKGDIKGEILCRSFGMDKFYFYKFGSFLQRCKYINKSILILKNIKNINTFCKIRIKKIDIGLLSYDSFMRYTRNPTAKEVNFKLTLFFAEGLFASDFFEKIFHNQNITKLVQSEIQFIPLSILFHNALLKKNKVYVLSASQLVNIKIYTKFAQRFAGENFSKKIFNEIFKNYKTKSIKLINKYYQKRIKAKFYGADRADTSVVIKNLDKDFISISKSSLCKKFNWDKKKKIATIFLHIQTDGNYKYGRRRIFLDNHTWTYYTLETIKKLKNVNWIIKEHPHEFYYNTKFDFLSLVKDLEKKYDHIRWYPENFNPASLIKFTDLAITSHGTAGAEYPSFGIPSINAEKSGYTGLGFTLEPKNRKEYKNLLKRAHKINKLTKQKIEKAKIYLFIRNMLVHNKLSMVPPYDPGRQIDENYFWYQSNQNLKKFNFNNDQFIRMFKNQLQLKHRDTVNYDLCSIK